MTIIVKDVFSMVGFGAVGLACGLGIAAYVSRTSDFDAATFDRCAQSEAACMAVAERMNVSVTIPPWQAMVLTPILDPR